MNRLQRTQEILIKLKARKKVHEKDLADSCRVCKKTIARDIEFIKDRYSEGIYKSYDDTGVFYALSYRDEGEIIKSTDVKFFPQDILITRLALQVLKHFSGLGITEVLDDISNKVSLLRMKAGEETHLEKLDRKLFSKAIFPRKYSGKRGTFTQILSALLLSNKLKISYRNLNNKVKTHIVHPYSLVVYDNVLYLLAKTEKVPERVGPTTFALDRIIWANRMAAHKFNYPEDWNPEKWEMFQNERTAIVIEFEDYLEPILNDRVWPEGTTITKTRVGSVRVRTTMVNREKTIAWLLGFGDDAEIISPKELREDIREHLSDTLKLYRSKKRKVSSN